MRGAYSDQKLQARHYAGFVPLLLRATGTRLRCWRIVIHRAATGCRVWHIQFIARHVAWIVTEIAACRIIEYRAGLAARLALECVVRRSAGRSASDQ